MKFEQLIYIASVGYSGSTLLDMLLGSQDDTTALGEIALLARYARDNANCTCGAPLSECVFWKNKETALKRRTGTEISLDSYDLTPENVKQTIFRKLPSITDVSLVLGNRQVWDFACFASEHARAYREASRNALQLFDIVCEEEDTTRIVDSSKYALPMKSLYMELKDRVKVIYLVRDGRAVSKSLMHRQGLSMKQAVEKWVRFNKNLQLILKTIPREQIYQLSYERLCLDTKLVFMEISCFLGKSTSLQVKPFRKEEFHDIGGNPMRFDRQDTEIKYNEHWKEEITNEEIAIFNKIGSKMNRKLGYSDSF